MKVVGSARLCSETEEALLQLNTEVRQIGEERTIQEKDDSRLQYMENDRLYDRV